MIPLGSVGGCHSKVIEEAVTLATVTFWGGSDGSESQTERNLDEKISTYNVWKDKYFICEASTCICGGKADVDQHSSISQSGPAGDRGIVETLWVHINNHWCLCHILPQLTRFIPMRESNRSCCVMFCFLFKLLSRSIQLQNRDSCVDELTHQTLIM